MRTAGKFVVISSMFILAGCAYHRPPVVYTTPSGQVLSAGPDARTAADRALETGIRAELNQYGDLGTANPNVQLYAHNGTVTVSGPVRNERDRQLIETLVRNTPGVASVNDQLQVIYPPTGAVSSPPYSAPPPIYPAPVITNPSGVPRVEAANVADESLARRAADELRGAVPSDYLQNVTIRMNNGAAYVQGTVANQQQREAIDSALQHVSGVTAVYDQLQFR